jgi:prepilin-type N-terminal cleavage/methylation domain-containing protein
VTGGASAPAVGGGTVCPNAGETAYDDGFTVIEMLVALVIVSVGLLALLDGIISAVHSQREKVQRAAAARVASTAIESARQISWNTLLANVPSPGVPSRTTLSKTMSKTSYTYTTTTMQCSTTDNPATCTAPASSGTQAVRVSVNVVWTVGGKQHSLAAGTTITNASSSSVNASGSGTIAGLLGGTTSGTSVTLGTLTVTPSSLAATAANNPASAVTVSMTAVGLSSTTSIPLTWTDDTGSHQLALTSSGGGTWSVSVPASSVTKAPASGSTTATVAFTATAPTGNGIQTANLTLVTQPSFTSCSVSPNPLTLQLLSTTKLANAETLTCTVKALSSSDHVRVSYATPTSTQTSDLTTTDGGTTWKLVLAAGTQVHSGLSTTFTFTATRQSDNASASTSVTCLQA